MHSHNPIQVFAADHKGLPAVAYGLFRQVKRLKPELEAQKHRIGELLRADPSLEVRLRRVPTPPLCTAQPWEGSGPSTAPHATPRPCSPHLRIMSLPQTKALSLNVPSYSVR